MQKVDFDFSINDEVKVKELGVIGHVVGLYYGETGKQYEVAYFYDGDFKKLFIYGFQLSFVNPVQSDGGFNLVKHS